MVELRPCRLFAAICCLRRASAIDASSALGGFGKAGLLNSAAMSVTQAFRRRLEESDDLRLQNVLMIYGFQQEMQRFPDVASAF